MINVTYKGQNYVMFGKIKIKNGVNPILEDEFYRLMRNPLFKYRIENGIFTVPANTPLERKKMEKTTEKTVEKEVETEVQKTDDQSLEKDTKKKTKEKESRTDEII